MGPCSENEEKPVANDTGTSGGTTTEDTSAPQRDEPLQLFEFLRSDNGGNTTIKLVDSTINQIVSKAGIRPISIICICGPSRQGKSFILGHMIRCLESLENEETDWMDWGNKSKPLQGFKFRNGTTPETQGIWVWSRPFIVKYEEDKEIAVLLIDTQGTYDEFTTSKDMSAIVGLSLLTSSVMIFNCFTNLQEDILSSMNTYTHYGQLALDNAQDTPFQKLIFLIRDWNNPGEYPYGSKGGKKFLEEKLKIKPDQAAESKQVRETIKKCFKDLDCFLMPNIGEKALYEQFTGSIGELLPAFAKKMEEFISSLISSETLVVKEILGGAVSAPELRSYLDNYLEVFNSSEIPSAQHMWEATSDVHNTHMMKKACQKFMDLIKKKLRGNSYLPVDVLEKAQLAAEKQALELFKKARKFGSPEKIAEYEEQLERTLKKERMDIKKQNDEKRNKYIHGVLNDATTQFRNLLEEALPFDNDDDEDDMILFYEDSTISREADQAKHAVITEMKDKLDSETEEIIAAKIESLEAIVESIELGLINKNKAMRADAEKKIMTVLGELVSDLEEQLKDFLIDNEFAESDELKKYVDDATASTLGSWKKAKKPGKKGFHTEYLTKLEKELSSLSSRFENEHKLKMHKCQQNADVNIEEACNDYEDQLMQQLEKIEIDEELEIMHKEMSQETVENFCLNGNNPFPEGHSLHTQLNNRLQAQLESVFEKVQREVVHLQLRCQESYREAVEEALNHYGNEMNEVLMSSEFLSDKDLEVEHELAYKVAIQAYEDFEKVGFPDDALEYKVQLRKSIEKRMEIFKENNHQKRQLAHSKAKNCVTDCHAKYEEFVKREMDQVRTDEELEDLHKQSLKEAKQLFQEKCPAKEDPEFVEKYETELDGEIEDTYEELKDLFEMRRKDEENAKKVILVDRQKYYHDEMQKHCKNSSFIRPDHLDKHHEQSCKVVIEKCMKLTPLSAFQKMDLEREMNDLYLKYKIENDMKLNSIGGAPPAIGIDLGTTYCCVAVYVNGKVHIIPNQEQGNTETTASYVTFNPDGSTTIGDVAKQNAFKNPENTIYDAKRIIGRKIDNPELQEDMKFWPFVVKDDAGIPKLYVNGKLYFPERVSAELLEALVEMAEKHLGYEPKTITKAVITVPAYFNDGQRQATIDAGHLARLDVLTILNEPTAAAIAYTLERFDTSARKVLIFDLGGGTFDVAVLDVSPANIQVLGVDGDTHLGGEDFDQKMMEYCALMFKAKEGIDLFDGKDSSVKQERDDARRRLRRLQTYCEAAKKNLSTARTTTVSIDAMYEGIDLTVEVTRDKFEELNEPLFKKTIDIVERALREKGVRKEEVDDIVLVGGSTRILKVRELLTNYFEGKALNHSIHADHAVAYGAAVQAAMMNGEQAKGQIDFDKIQDVTPLSLGIETVDEVDRITKRFSVIIPKNTAVPKKAKEIFRTVKDNQENCHIKIFQGEDPVPTNNELLGDFILEGIPHAKAGKECIDVIMDVDTMGILHVEAVCKSNKVSNKITVRENKQRMSAETKSRLLAEANPAA